MNKSPFCISLGISKSSCHCDNHSTSDPFNLFRLDNPVCPSYDTRPPNVLTSLNITLNGQISSPLSAGCIGVLPATKSRLATTLAPRHCASHDCEPGPSTSVPSSRETTTARASSQSRCCLCPEGFSSRQKAPMRVSFGGFANVSRIRRRLSYC